MRRAGPKGVVLMAVVTLGGLAGCKSFSDVDQARPYSCNWRDAGVAECPTGWRCGYDNRCFDPKVPVGLKTCKFNQDCFDGFRCNAENACFNPGVELARACRESADCAPTWRCGIGGVCQNRNDAGPYPCVGDNDCEQGWRCDVLAQVCGNVTDTLFGEDRPLASVTIHPKHELPVPRQFAMSVTSNSGPSDSLRTMALVFDGGIVLQGRDGNDRGYYRVVGVPPAASPAQLAEVVAIGDQVLLRSNDGEVLSINFFDGGFSRTATNVARIRQIDPDPSRGRFDDFQPSALLAIGQNGFKRFDNRGVENYDGGFTPLGTLLDVAGYEGELYTLRDWGIVHEPDSRPLDGCQHRFFPKEVRLPTFDGGQPTCHSNEAQAFGKTDAGVRYTLLVAKGTGQVGFAVMSAFPDGGVLVSIALMVNGGGGNLRVGPATPVCPGGRSPLQISVSLEGSQQNDQRASLLSRCPEVSFADGMVPAATWQISTNSNSDDRVAKFSIYSDDNPQWRQGLVAQTTTSNARVHAGRNGLAWADQLVAGTRSAMPFLLDRVPGAILRFSLNGAQNIFALTDSHLYEYSESLGLSTKGENLQSNGSEYVPAGPVLGQPNWEITGRGVIDLGNFPLGSEQPRFVVRLKPLEANLSSPSAGQIQTLDNGRRVLVIFSGDRLYSADVTDVEKNPYLPPEVLEVRLVPTAGVRLRGIAIDGTPRQQADAGVVNIATGFVLTNSALFAFSAVTQARWAVTPVPLPERFGIPIQLWSEKGRARLAFDRGTVMTLPERVPLSGDLPVTTGDSVSDFGRLCGTTYAVRNDGVYRAVFSDGGSTWRSVSVPGLPNEELGGSRFFPGEGAIFLATPAGRVIELSLGRADGGLPACP